MWREAVPVISNHTGTSEDSVATTPTMCATGSLSMTEKVKGDSSKSKGAASAGSTGLRIHSICRRQVEDFWGRPLSTALIWEREAQNVGSVKQCSWTCWCKSVFAQLSGWSYALNTLEVTIKESLVCSLLVNAYRWNIPAHNISFYRHCLYTLGRTTDLRQKASKWVVFQS